MPSKNGINASHHDLDSLDSLDSLGSTGRSRPVEPSRSRARTDVCLLRKQNCLWRKAMAYGATEEVWMVGDRRVRCLAREGRGISV